MMRKNVTHIIILLFMFCSGVFQKSYSQHHYSKQVFITTENDLYMLQGKDRYYTNGIFIGYRQLKPATRNTIKRIDQLELAQKLFIQQSRKISSPSEIDRPVTGYLYFSFKRDVYHTTNTMMQYGIRGGTIGQAAFGKWMQNTVHKIIGVNADYWGWIWNYQLNSAPGIDILGRYDVALPISSRQLMIASTTEASLGTMFTHLKQGLIIELGKMNPLYQNSYWGAAVTDKKTTPTSSEFYVFYHPELTWQLYNATIQGAMFRRDKGPITSSLKPLVLQHSIGVSASYKRYSLKLAAVFQTKEAATQLHTHNYGSISGTYHFN